MEEVAVRLPRLPRASHGTTIDFLDTPREVAALAKKMGLKLVTFHAGFMPHDESDPLFGRLMERMRY